MIPTRHQPLVQLGAVLVLVPFLGAALDSRTYAAGKFALDISGIGAVNVKSFDGGSAVQAPITRGARADKYPDKSPGPVRYEDATVEFPMPLTRGLWDWINVFSSPGQVPGKTLTLSTMDYNYVEKSRRVFDESVISVVEIPACDSGAKAPGHVKMTLAVGRAKEDGGTAGAKPTAAKAGAAKPWMTSNFRLSIDGLTTNQIVKIDPIVIKHSPKGSLEYSNLVITVADTDTEAWKGWAAQSIDGKPVEKNGKLELLSQSLAETLLTVQLEGLGVVRLAPEQLETGGTQIARTKVELYVEKIVFVPPPG